MIKDTDLVTYMKCFESIVRINWQESDRDDALHLCRDCNSAGLEETIEVLDRAKSNGFDEETKCAIERTIGHIKIVVPTGYVCQDYKEYRRIIGDLTRVYKTLRYSAALNGNESTIRFLLNKIYSSDKQRQTILYRTDGKK